MMGDTLTHAVGAAQAGSSSPSSRSVCIPIYKAGAGVSPEVLAGLPAITTPGFKFEQTKLTAKAGETVALRLDNTHNAPHRFDVDALNVHVSAAPGQRSLILFKPTMPGTYTFYCGIPSHRELGMEGTLIVEP